MELEKFSMEKLRIYLHFEMLKCVQSAVHSANLDAINIVLDAKSIDALFNRTVCNSYGK